MRAFKLVLSAFVIWQQGRREGCEGRRVGQFKAAKGVWMRWSFTELGDCIGLPCPTPMSNSACCSMNGRML